MGELIKLNTRNGFSIKVKSEKEAEITIYSEIGESFWFDSFSAKDFDDKLKELPSTVNHIVVRLNSPGGDVFDGYTIYNRLRQHKAKVTVYIDGLAASIASVIALAGDEVYIGEGGFFMIHRPWTGVVGNASDMEATIQLLDNIEEQLIKVYHKKTKIDKVELRRLMEGNANEDGTWMNADKAIELGFVDGKMEEEESLDVAASIKNSTILKNRKLPGVNPAKIKEKISKFKQDVESFLAR
jgi:ATP-dependent protease ClpP protease subunit